MNQRIEKIIDQAYIELNKESPDRFFGQRTIAKKVAELIVADCLKQIKDGLVDESELLYEHEETTECVNEALMDAHHNIAIHFGFAEQFGVEE